MERIRCQYPFHILISTITDVFYRQPRRGPRVVLWYIHEFIDYDAEVRQGEARPKRSPRGLSGHENDEVRPRQNGDIATITRKLGLGKPVEEAAAAILQTRIHRIRHGLPLADQFPESAQSVGITLTKDNRVRGFRFIVHRDKSPSSGARSWPQYR